MVNILERVIASLWFGALGYLLIPFFVFSFHLTFIQLVISILLMLVAMTFGFLYGYKNVFQSTEHPNLFITRSVAAVWCGLIGLLIAQGIMSITISISNQPNILEMGVIIISVFIFILLGLIYVYRLLLLPSVSYSESFPELSQRILAMLWFGSIGSLIQAFFLHGPSNPNSLFVIILVSFLGFTYGSRILLLPASIKAALKSLIMGFIGSSFILLIVILFLFLPMYFTAPDVNQSSFVYSIVEGLIAQFYFFLFASIFVCIPAMISAFILYILIIIFRI